MTTRRRPRTFKEVIQDTVQFIENPAVPKPGNIIVDKGKKTVIRVKEVKGYRPGGIYVVLDDEGHEQMIRYDKKAWYIV